MGTGVKSSIVDPTEKLDASKADSSNEGFAGFVTRVVGASVGRAEGAAVGL